MMHEWACKTAEFSTKSHNRALDRPHDASVINLAEQAPRQPLCGGQLRRQAQKLALRRYAQMPTGSIRVYICFGTPERHLGRLETAARTGWRFDFDWWNIKKSAARLRIRINSNRLLSRA